jgi:hypothetical protein
VETSALSCVGASSSVTSKSNSALARFSSASLAVVPVVFDDHPLGRQLGRELDAFNGFLVGGVGSADEQAVAALAQCQDLVLGGDLGVDQVAWQLLLVDGVQVQQRQRQRGGQHMCQVVRLHGTRCNGSGDKADLAFAGRLRQVLGHALRQLAGVHKHPGHTRQLRRRWVDDGLGGHQQVERCVMSADDR